MRAAAPGLLLAGLLVAGCAADDQGPPTSAATVTSPPAEAPAGDADESDASGSLPCVAGVDRVPVPAAVDEEDAMTAYCTAVELTREHAFTRLVLPGEAEAAPDFRGVCPFLTDRARSRWDAAVDAWLEQAEQHAGARLDGGRWLVDSWVATFGRGRVRIVTGG